MTDPDTGWVDLPVLDVGVGYFVYALLGSADDVPLYIGQSRNVLCRIGTHLAHAGKKGKVTRVAVRRCESQADMDATELRLIQHYMPVWNVTGIAGRRPKRKQIMPSAAPVTLSPLAQLAPLRPDRMPSGFQTPWMLPDQSAAYLGISRRQLLKHVKEGVIRAGYGNRMHVTWLDDWLIATNAELSA